MSQRVCMVLPDPFPPDVRVEKEVRALHAAGHDVTVLCRGTAGDPARETVALDGVAVDVVRVCRGTPLERVANVASAAVDTAVGVHPRWLAALERVVSRTDADALHVHDLPLVRTATLAARRHDLPVVADLHENYPEAVRQWRRDAPAVTDAPLVALKRALVPISRWKRRERRALAGVDHVLTVVAEAREHYVADCGLDGEDVSVVSNTVARDDFDPARAEARDAVTDDEAFTAAYVGGFGPHRGLETAIRSLTHAADVELLLVGDGPLAADLRALAADCGVAERVTFTGWVDRDAVPGYLAASDACLVPHAATPHTATTIPHKLFQYMAMGTPVVVSDLAPLRRVVADADAGVVSPPGDDAALADALAGLAANPERAARHGENARAAVEETYHWARDAAVLRDVYAD